MGSWTSAGTQQVVPKALDNWTEFQIITWKKRLFGPKYNKAAKFNLSQELCNICMKHDVLYIYILHEKR